MKRTKITGVIALTLSILFVLGSMTGALAASEGSTTIAIGNEVAEAIEILGDIKWKAYSALYSGEKFYTGSDVFADMSSAKYTVANAGDELAYEFDAAAVMTVIPRTLYYYTIRAGGIMKANAHCVSRLDYCEALYDRLLFFERKGKSASAGVPGLMDNPTLQPADLIASIVASTSLHASI